jgi:RNA-binding protein YlmH
MMDRRLSHITDSEDRQAMSRILDQADIVVSRKQTVFTDFLSPLHISLAQDIIQGIPDIRMSVWGGYEDAERKVLAIYPDFREDPEEFPIRIYQVSVKTGSQPMSHRDYLGSIMGLGIVRETLGDIVVIDETSAALIIHERMEDYLIMNLTKVARANASLEQIKAVDSSWIDYQDRFCTLSSLRLDMVLSQGLQIPRNKAEQLIRADSVKVDWKTMNKPGVQLKPGSMISCRGFGRLAFMEQTGTSKKGKYQVILRRYQ